MCKSNKSRTGFGGWKLQKSDERNPGRSKKRYLLLFTDQRLNIVKITIFPKLIHQFTIIPIKVSRIFFNLDNPILKGTGTAKIILKDNKVRRIILTDLKT